MKLTPEEEAIFDKQYQVLVEAAGQARDWLASHKEDIKGIVEKVKDMLPGPTKNR